MRLMDKVDLSKAGRGGGHDDNTQKSYMGLIWGQETKSLKTWGQSRGATQNEETQSSVGANWNL